MSLAKSDVAKRNRPADVTPNDSAVEPLELSCSLMKFAADANRDSSLLPETEPDGSTLFEICDDLISTARPDAVAETRGAKAELVDPSKWFEFNDVEFLDERVEDQPITPSEESLSDFTCASAAGITIYDTVVMDDYSSTASNADETGNEVVDSAVAQASEPAEDERRTHPREDTSDLVWVEYFNSSMECIGKEAGRAENVGAGGMRVGIKTAPPEMERVIVSYPYRGFESCSMVRRSYRDESGQHHLCLEFVDREWKVNAASASGESTADLVNPRKILLADDDAAFRKILGNILIRAGYEVVLAEDGQSAVEKATIEKPDLVITDGLMPKLHGFEVCKAVKELNPRPGVIMLTAVYTSPNHKWEVKAKFGADDVITKPCQIADLLRKIEKHMPPAVFASNALIARPPV